MSLLVFVVIQLLLRCCQGEENEIFREIVDISLIDASCAVGGNLDNNPETTEIIVASAHGIDAYWRQSPSKYYNSTWISLRIWSTVDESPNRVLVVDMNGDSYQDVVHSGLRLDYIYWHENMHGDGLTWISHEVSTSRIGSFDIAVADIDSNGFPDIIEANFFDDSIAVHYQQSDGSWLMEIIHQHYPVSQAVAVCIADLNADNLLDIAAVGRDFYVSWFENGNDWATHLAGYSPKGYDAIACVTMENDRTDLVVATTSDDTIEWLQNNGLDDWRSIQVTSSAAAVHRLAAVSGFVFSANYRSGEIVLYIPSESFDSFYALTLDDDVPQATFVSFSDVNNQGQLDLIWTGNIAGVGWLDLPYHITENSTSEWFSITIAPTNSPTTATPTFSPTASPTVSAVPTVKPTSQNDTGTENNQKSFNFLWIIAIIALLLALLFCYCFLRCFNTAIIGPLFYRYHHIIAPRLALCMRRFPLVYKLCCCTYCTCRCCGSLIDEEELEKIADASEDPLHPRDGVLLQDREAPVIPVHGEITGQKIRSSDLFELVNENLQYHSDNFCSTYDLYSEVN